MREGQGTPWGPAQHVKEILPGFWWVSTAGHGGIFLSLERFEKMPAYMASTPYSQGGWYEEDIDWCLPYVVFEEELKTAGEDWTRKVIMESKHIAAFQDSYHKNRREQWEREHQVVAQ